MAQRLCHAPGSEVIDQGQGHVINLALSPKRPRRIISYFFQQFSLVPIFVWESRDPLLMFIDLV